MKKKTYSPLSTRVSPCPLQFICSVRNVKLQHPFVVGCRIEPPPQREQRNVSTVFIFMPQAGAQGRDLLYVVVLEKVKVVLRAVRLEDGKRVCILLRGGVVEDLPRLYHLMGAAHVHQRRRLPPGGQFQLLLHVGVGKDTVCETTAYGRKERERSHARVPAPKTRVTVVWRRGGSAKTTVTTKLRQKQPSPQNCAKPLTAVLERCMATPSPQFEYAGETKDGCWHGYGRLFRNGTLIYQGQWEMNKRQGLGKEFEGNVCHAGVFKDDLLNGFGTSTLIDRDHLIYEGNWKDGAEDGQGTCYAPHTSLPHTEGCWSYKGEWKNGRYHGRGKIVRALSSTTVYEGTFAFGERFGHGSAYSEIDGKERLIYDGQWSNNTRTGVGTAFMYYTPETSSLSVSYKIKSGWNRDLRHGWTESIRVLQDGREIVVETAHYVCGKRSGPCKVWNHAGILNEERILVFDGNCENDHWVCGKEYDAGRLCYKGDFSKDFIRHGQGLQFDKKENLIYSGSWDNTTRHGHGTEYFQNGKMKYEGGYCRNRRHGEGIEYRCGRNGSHTFVYDGQWKDGIKHGTGVHEKYGNCVWTNGRYNDKATKAHVKEMQRVKVEADTRKTSRQQLIDFCTESKYLSDVKVCPLCLDEMLEGDEIYVFNQCGHRVCACIQNLTDDTWQTKCAQCKSEGQKRIRLY